MAIIPSVPVTAGLAVAAIAVSALFWLGIDVSACFENHASRHPWELLTSALPHLSIFHLAFNVYWLWVFGTSLELAFGRLRMLALVLLLAATSAAAEYALLQGGVGLSGIGYGLFGLMWVLNRRHIRFRGSLPDQTSWLFIGWFFLCVILTYTGTMPVANIAHGVGALVGAAVGMAVTAKRRERIAWSSVIGVFTVASILGVVAFRPLVNVSPYLAPYDLSAARETAQMGYDLIIEGKPRQAARLYEYATRNPHAPAGSYFNLGLCYQELGRLSEARGAYDTAASLDPTSAEFRAARDALSDIPDTPATKSRYRL